MYHQTLCTSKLNRPPWFPLQAYIFRPKGRGITPKLLLK
jgi:hypothetical protein